MSVGEKITHVLNGTIESVKNVIPIPIVVGKPSLFKEPLLKSEIGVLIGMIGSIRGSLVIKSRAKTFCGIGEEMFGMHLDGEMLQSFTGELGNMLAGNLCTILAGKGIDIDITPPTVVMDGSIMHNSDLAFRVGVDIIGKGEIGIVLMLEN
ncbi:chemotaxis protein CheX [Bacillus sp. P2(2020)]|uniref:Chemotaxis protein CheX n=1 Tax=Calidifontibacillus erzurumensis TaxID=2741433 RepID=A0A8J8K930_9BACI|nr:chemotaxis protein CheX [Calidifontibacillus erzurumensis]